jgi:hypothetical protein
MKKYLFLITFICSSFIYSQRTIHVFVALCDNVNQGIVPVSKNLGNGQSTKSNLYWGALYGVKTHFNKSKDWKFVKNIKSKNPQILERILWKHISTNTFLFAEAYDGKYIQNTTVDFLEATAGNNPKKIKYENQFLNFGGSSDLITYVGHDGLMEFDVKGNFKPKNNLKRDAIILACISKDYFKPYLKQTNANPLVWTTGLMAPEAYTLKWAIDSWIKKETDIQITINAAKAYNYYQKCGLMAAKKLLVTGY